VKQLKIIKNLLSMIVIRKISWHPASRLSTFFVCAAVSAVLCAPFLSYAPKPLSVEMVGPPRDENTIAPEVQLPDPETIKPQNFNPDDFDMVNYVRDDTELANRGEIVKDSEDLLFGTVEELVLDTKSIPPDMTFEEDYTQIFVTVGILNMRTLPSLNSEILHTYSFRDSLVRTGIGAEWERVINADGQVGYMKKEYLADTKPTPSPTPTKAAPVKANTQGESIAQEAQKYLGIRYKHAAADPTKGFDCSGLTWYVYNRYGINTPRGTSSYANAGTVIPYSQIAPGDVIAWNVWGGGKSTRIEHVGIYIGNGMMIHASSTNRAVVKVSVSQYRAWGPRIISVHRFSKN
jgi:cell wall-associated NlpC family hydrolase